MDGANALIHLGLRPTQVVTSDRATTQAWALAAFREDAPGRAGISWWSFHRPQWTVVGLWQPKGKPPTHRFTDVQRLDIDHQDVLAAAAELARRITR